MSSRRLFALIFVCALTLGSPVLLPATGGGGEATQLYQDGDQWICVWQCYNGTGGSAPVSRPGVGQKCLNLCGAACGGPCIALY